MFKKFKFSCLRGNSKIWSRFWQVISSHLLHGRIGLDPCVQTSISLLRAVAATDLASDPAFESYFHLLRILVTLEKKSNRYIYSQYRCRYSNNFREPEKSRNPTGTQMADRTLPGSFQAGFVGNSTSAARLGPFRYLEWSGFGDLRRNFASALQ